MNCNEYMHAFGLFMLFSGTLMGLWFGLLPYMLLRYRDSDMFGNGRYVKR